MVIKTFATDTEKLD